MQYRFLRISLICVIFCSRVYAQSTPPGALATWTLSATVADESVGQGLPVLALDRPDWADHLSTHTTNARAFRAIKVELSATHPTGWRIATLTRAEAWLHANADAVTLAALDAKGTNPDAVRSFSLNARSQSWQGDGFMLGSPWWPLDSAGLWQWKTDVAWLQLKQFRAAELAGDVYYRGGGKYDFDLHSQSSNTGITSPFLPVSGISGTGESLSLALQGQLAPRWRVQLRADDVVSRLQWLNMATDTNALNSQVTSRAPDGSLDYAPLLKGKKTLRQLESQIGAYWQAQMAWTVNDSGVQPSALILRTTSKADINQLWLGWDSGEGVRTTPHWRIEFEPSWQAVKLDLSWRGVQVVLTTDAKGLNTQCQQVKISWVVAL